jgi:ppGpp synthetase/RelA/SpoT-type nucleotidyltranferase
VSRAAICAALITRPAHASQRRSGTRGWQNWESADWRQWDDDLAVINNWRASHAYPLLAIRLRLEGYAEKADANSLVAQRIKRLASIGAKLDARPKMKLTQMQDIGGCRAVVGSMSALRELIRCHKQSRSKHLEIDSDDYLETPRDSGYRSFHLVYRFHSEHAARSIYNGLQIETQLRSQFQHAWATAVETAGTFTGEALKSSMGSEELLRFFALMGTVIALRENTPPVPGTPTNHEDLIEELRQHARDLNVAARLIGFGNALRAIRNPSAEQANAYYYLLQLDAQTDPPELSVSGFRQEQYEQASELYLEAEKQAKQRPGRDAVLVSVDSLAELERAYPNYFADTRVFVELISQALSGKESNIPQPAMISMETA